MKVIVAGFSKTGTKSMCAALRQLGYTVYDVEEHFRCLGDKWKKILEEGGTTEDFRQMYEGVDAVTDTPAFYFWEELHKAYPGAKIVLTLRDDEDTWAKSFNNNLVTEHSLPVLLVCLLSPSAYKFSQLVKVIHQTTFGIKVKTSYFFPIRYNDLLLRMTYRRHNSHVIQTAPKDKLLVFNVKQGWDPLCKFLGVEVPKTPFPHENKKASMSKKFMDENPFAVKCKREAVVSLALITSLLAYGCYKIIRKSTLELIKSSVTNVSNYFMRSLSCI